MRVGIVSDSHQNLDSLRESAQWLVKKEKVEVIIHLGDDWDDARILDEFEVEVIKVPGVFSNYYQDPDIPNRKIVDFEGWKVLLTHTNTSHENDLPTDLNPEEVIAKKEVNVVLYGHTHIPKIEEVGKVLYLNPGHLKKEDKKGHPPSFGVIEFGKEKVEAKIIDLERSEEVSTCEFKG